jgi:hypothetical protein
MFKGKYKVDGHLIELYADRDYDIWSRCTELISTGVWVDNVPKHISDWYYCEFRTHNNLRYKDISNVGIDMFELTTDKEIKILLRNYSSDGRVKICGDEIIGYLLFKKKEII